MAELIESLKIPRRYIISGYAGYGKSMSLRYIALSLFENPLGKIPIFIELRRLNGFVTPNLLSYINSTYAQGTSVSQKAFENALNSGVFVFLLDGFDELSHEIRESMETQIKSLVKQFPGNSVIVSGRPSENKYVSWSDFKLLKLQPMTKLMVIELINKLDYDQGVKKRFSAKISELFDRHESFLSTPLLAILMLMTFQKNANIPDKMYLFYGRAFETLFNQHDAIKEQYERPRKTSLQIDEFSSIFSTFCFATYVKEKFEFSKTEVSTFLRDATKYHKSEVDIERLLYDLQESVCLLVSEGGDYFFVHRSFQEYFTAVFLSSCPEEDRDRFLDSNAARGWDGVLPMLFDMSSEQLIATWLKRKMSELLKDVGHKEGQIRPLDARFKTIYFAVEGDAVSVWHISWGECGSRLSILKSLLSVNAKDRVIELEVLNRYLADHFEELKEKCGEIYIGGKSERPGDYAIDIDDLPASVLEQSGMVDLANAEIEALRKVWRKIERDRISRNSFISGILDSERRL